MYTIELLSFFFLNRAFLGGDGTNGFYYGILPRTNNVGASLGARTKPTIDLFHDPGGSGVCVGQGQGFACHVALLFVVQWLR